MARARNIKPAFFKNEALGDLPYECRLLFIGLWTLADRDGRLEDRPRRIRAEIFPFDSIDVDPMLDQLQAEEFLLRYEVDGERFIEVLNFVKHQDPHYKEKASEIPPPHGRENIIKATAVTKAQRARIFARDDHCCQQCGAEENLCIDHIIPTSRGGDSSDENLQVLCMKCNTKKGNKLDGESKGKKKSKHMDAAVIVRHNANLSMDQVRVEHESKSNERNDASPSDSLIPDSPSSDSLIPDCGENTLSGKPDDAREILVYLNEKTASAYRPVESNLQLIRARLASGVTAEQVQEVIDAKVAKWGRDPKMQEYLRPTTLFRASNFEQYLGQLGRPALVEAGPAWHETDAGYQSKAEELGLQRKDSEPFQWFKWRIAKKVGDQGVIDKLLSAAQRDGIAEHERAFQFFHGRSPTSALRAPEEA